MNETPSISTILYATDLGDQAKPVFKHALALAKQYGAKIVMIHVVEPMNEATAFFINSYTAENMSEEVQKETMKKILTKMKERLKKFYADECGGQEAGSPVKDLLVVSGRPSEEILRVAEEDKADMIIMGKSTRRVRGIRVMGSTARRVSRMSDVPVLIVPNY
ncbi:universal stress protein [Desulforhopalus sp. IMCC35007]|uniref:universal stress protein n=1 Tax=Desulforhopalus sp. IMCC35007 TaxID=2569543 RepID=UPI0010AED9E6|nr:universal stress protein [Desulforhopalus sp. IMCC35007]TKB06772.1 universal stress protein [Desulforhopalus sp. IMCC35007]